MNSRLFVAVVGALLVLNVIIIEDKNGLVSGFSVGRFGWPGLEWREIIDWWTSGYSRGVVIGRNYIPPCKLCDMPRMFRVDWPNTKPKIEWDSTKMGFNRGNDNYQNQWKTLCFEKLSTNTCLFLLFMWLQIRRFVLRAWLTIKIIWQFFDITVFLFRASVHRFQLIQRWVYGFRLRPQSCSNQFTHIDKLYNYYS